MAKNRIGIDPGKEGYICVWNGEEHSFFPIPKIGKGIDLGALREIIKELAYEDDDVHCVLEDVHAIFGASAGSTFAFGRVQGAIEAFLHAYKIPHTLVQPKKWQRFCWEGIPLQQKPSSTGKTKVTDTKKMSLMAATRLFPNIDLRKSERAKKAHDGKVDALLLCYYCNKNF